jgi:hypothetical protein
MAHLIDNDALLLGANVSDFGARHIVRLSEEEVRTIHINDSGNLEVHKSTDSGVNWTLMTTFTPVSGSLSYPSICKYDSTTFVVAWVEGVGTNYDVKVKMCASEVWTDILTWSFTDIGAITIPIPAITFNKTALGRLHIFVPHHATTNIVTIKNKYTDNFGGLWTDGTNYAGGTRTAPCPIHDIASRSDTGIVTIGFRNYTAQPYKFYHFTSVGVWSSETNKSMNSSINGASCAYDSANILRYAVIDNSPLGTIRLWDDTFWVSGCLEGMIALGIDGADNVYVFYTKTDEICYYKKWTKIGATWGSEVQLTTGDGQKIKCEQNAIPSSPYLHLVYFSD